MVAEDAVDFTPLVVDLKRHYHTFDQNFKHAKRDSVGDETSFILFGVTGAGKVRL